jgi:hypothetical protein
MAPEPIHTSSPDLVANGRRFAPRFSYCKGFAPFSGNPDDPASMGVYDQAGALGAAAAQTFGDKR